jgi:hypothetical protein
MKCRACSRNAGEKDFCPLHSRAHENTLQAYCVWRKGLKIPWQDYLRRIKENPLTGIWAKEVAEYLTNKEEEEHVEKS